MEVLELWVDLVRLAIKFSVWINFHKFSWNMFHKIHSYGYIILKILFKLSIYFCC